MANIHQEARDDIFRDRIQRGLAGSDAFFSLHKLGGFNSDLMAVAVFFEQTWLKVSSNLSKSTQGWILNHAGFCLSALGRLSEAQDALGLAVAEALDCGQFSNAATYATNLSKTCVSLGNMHSAENVAKEAIRFAELADDNFERQAASAALARVLHQKKFTKVH